MLGELEAAQIYRRCFEDSTDSIVITDKAGKIIEINQAWSDLYGYSRVEACGHSLKLIQSPHTDPAMVAHMWQQILDPEIGAWRGKIVNLNREGAEIPVLLTITPIRQTAEIVGYMGIGIDQRAEQELAEFKALYEMVMRHDLKAPLGSLLLKAEILLDGYLGDLAPKQQQALERIRANAQQMQAIIATSLDLKKLESRGLVLHPEHIEMVSFIEERLVAFNEMAAAKEIALKASINNEEKRNLTLFLDRTHLSRCLDNLLKNAIEAAPSHSLVGIKLSSEGPGRAQVCIHNEGKPIPADVKATLFKPFSTAGKRGGTGLGLYGVKLTMEAMGGEVSFESGESGTTFCLHLIQQAEEAPTQ